MSVPSPAPPDGFRAHTVAWIAADALSWFADDLDRPTAAILLPKWRLFGEVTPDEIEAVLAVFPPPDTDTEVGKQATGMECIHPSEGRGCAKATMSRALS